MAHELSGAFQQAARIREFRTTEEPYVDVSSERVDIGEASVRHARRRVAVVQQLSHIAPTSAHDVEPGPRDLPQLPRVFLHPGIYGGVSLDRAGEAQKPIHAAKS